MLSDFSAISPVWIRYCITEINMESIERNGLYDQIIIISGKKMKHLFNLLSSLLYCLVPSLLPQKIKGIGAILSKLG